jgi:hypothetical protein
VKKFGKPDMGRARRSVGIIVMRQQHEAFRTSLGKCSHPIGRGRDIRAGEGGVTHPPADDLVECPPLRDKRRSVIGLGSQHHPAAETVWLIPDLEGQEMRADGA